MMRGTPDRRRDEGQIGGRRGSLEYDGDGERVFHSRRLAGTPRHPDASESFPDPKHPGVVIDVVYFIIRTAPVWIIGLGICAAIIAGYASTTGQTFASAARMILVTLVGG